VTITGRVAVFVYANDPVSYAGIAGQLRHCPEIDLVEDGDPDAATVAVVVADEVDDETARVIRAVQRNGCPRVVVVVSRLDDAPLLAAVEAGACGFVRRSEANPEGLVKAVQAAALGNGSVPPDVLGRLLFQVGQMQREVLAPRGLNYAGLTERELDVLRLLADGFDTAEVARHLSYSERTVKSVVQDVTRRHNLRNRTHAVAYALRQGLI
jgi:DNA-binding NarL/FixJ family response regulator